MARMLADDPSTNLSIAGFLIIDSPYHIPRSELTIATCKSKVDDIPDLVQRAFDNCDRMLQHWSLPCWDGPACKGNDVEARVGGKNFALPLGRVLHKPVNDSWRPIKTQLYQHQDSGNEPATPPPAVMVRCTRPAAKEEGAGESEPCLIDLHREKTLLGWEGNYSDFIKAVMDVDADHYTVFDKFDQVKVCFAPFPAQQNFGLTPWQMKALTAQLNEGLEILDSLGRPAKQKPSLGIF